MKSIKDTISKEIRETALQEGRIPTMLDITGVHPGNGGILIDGMDRDGNVVVLFMYERALDNLKKGLAGEKIGDDEEPVQEVTPPGHEKQVKKLKKVLPSTYTDASGHQHKSNPWAVAWASYNKEK